MTEGRYLLSGASDAATAVYDIQRATEYKGGGLVAYHKSLFTVDKNHDHGHKFAVSSAIWYPVDTGLFVTASVDTYIKVWDTNETRNIMDFKMPGKVHGIAMSSIATSHMLIAAGSEDVQVRLCDIASGAFTHTLSGHHDGVMSLEWSTSSEWVLMTGGCDGAIRFWDIRRAGCFLVLDQSRSQTGRRPSFSKSTSKKILEGQSSSTKVALPQRRAPLANGKKHSANVRKDHTLNRGPAGQRLHPGMSSSYNRVTAHYGAVTGLKATRDGMYLISSGSDSRLRLWDIESGCNTLVNFEAKHLQTTRAIQLAVTEDSSLVFVPSMATVKAYDVWSGVTFRTFRGHYGTVDCCYFSSQDQELYTGSHDRQILVWSPPNPFVADTEEDQNGERRGVYLTDHDNWSD